MIISEFEAGYLKGLRQELEARGKLNPRLFVLVNYKEVAVDESSSEDPIYIDPNSGCKPVGNMEQLKQLIHDKHKRRFESYLEAEKYFSDYTWDEMLKDEDYLYDDYFDDFASKHLEFYKIWLERFREDVRTFFTNAEATKYLEEHRHQFHENAFVDEREIYNQPELKALLGVLYQVAMEQGKMTGEVHDE